MTGGEKTYLGGTDEGWCGCCRLSRRSSTTDSKCVRKISPGACRRRCCCWSTRGFTTSNQTPWPDWYSPFSNIWVMASFLHPQ